MAETGISPASETTARASSTEASATPTATSVGTDPQIIHGNPVANFLIGFLIITLASVMNAGGLNITKLDHVKNIALPKESRRPDYKRPLWYLGLGLYIISQLVGSTLALAYMRAEYVAPLGSSSLIFNFIFSAWLIGTKIDRNDYIGTALIVLGVCGVVGFGSINAGVSDQLNLEILRHLWGRLAWIIYCPFLSFATVAAFLSTHQLAGILEDRDDEEAGVPPVISAPIGEKPFSFQRAKRLSLNGLNRWRALLDHWTMHIQDASLRKIVGMAWAITGALLASETLILAKVTVKLISTQLGDNNTENQFLHPLSILTVIVTIVTAILQIICLNKALALYSTTLVVPLFYGIYTSLGFLNSLIFLDQIKLFKGWVLGMLAVSICVLLGGVILLSSKEQADSEDQAETELNQDAVPRRGTRRRGEGLLQSQDAEEGIVWSADPTEDHVATKTKTEPSLNEDDGWGFGDDEENAWGQEGDLSSALPLKQKDTLP